MLWDATAMLISFSEPHHLHFLRNNNQNAARPNKVTSARSVPCLCAQRASSRNEPEHQNKPPTSVNSFSATTSINCSKLPIIIDEIDAINPCYLNFCGRLMLRPLFVIVGVGAGPGSLPTSLPPTPDALQPSCPTACFF